MIFKALVPTLDSLELIDIEIMKYSGRNYFKQVLTFIIRCII